MCIIAVKEAGIKLPDWKIFENMWNNNDDGAGFMYTKDGSVIIEKGFMKYKAFKAALENVMQKIDTTKTPMVFHFRITTHGGTSAENCHPFPVCDDIKMLKKLKNRTNLGVAHNGIISSVTPRAGISDTMEYVATKLALMKSINRKFPENKYFRSIIELDITTDRMAFLSCEGKINMIGNFEFDKETGMYYSNSTYRYSGYRYMSAMGYNYGWDEDYTTYVPVNDVYDLGYNVRFGGNLYNEFGLFYADKHKNLYVYDDKEDIMYKANSAELISDGRKFRYDKESEYYMPCDRDWSYEDLFENEGNWEKCEWCGRSFGADYLKSTELGKLCPECFEEMQNG